MKAMVQHRRSFRSGGQILYLFRHQFLQLPEIFIMDAKLFKLRYGLMEILRAGAPMAAGLTAIAH